MTNINHSNNITAVTTFYIAGLAMFASTAWLGFMSDQPLMVSGIFYLNLFVLALYDIRFFRLPNLLTATLFITGAFFLWALQSDNILDHIIGAAVGLLLFPTLNFFYRRLRGHDGIGLGDAKLLAGLGLWLGWQALPPLLFAASLSGLFFALIRYLTIQNNEAQASLVQPLPFGAFLCLGGWLAWLFLPL